MCAIEVPYLEPQIVDGSDIATFVYGTLNGIVLWLSDILEMMYMVCRQIAV